MFEYWWETTFNYEIIDSTRYTRKRHGGWGN
jgi:hypothetical protein